MTRWLKCGQVFGIVTLVTLYITIGVTMDMAYTIDGTDYKRCFLQNTKANEGLDRMKYAVAIF